MGLNDSRKFMTDINELRIKDKLIKFERPIGVCLESKGVTYILVKTNSRTIFLNHNFHVDKFKNVLAFNSEGDLLWSIETAPLLCELDKVDPYSGLFFENEELIAYNMSGVNYIVDQADGRIRARDNWRPW